MTVDRFARTLFFAVLAALPTAPAQQPPAVPLPGVSSPSQRIKLDVVVNTKSGQPVNRPRPAGLHHPRQQVPAAHHFLQSHDRRPGARRGHPPYRRRQHALRDWLRTCATDVEKFLKANEGTLAHPTTIAVLTDQGVQKSTRLLHQRKRAQRRTRTPHYRPAQNHPRLAMGRARPPHYLLSRRSIRLSLPPQPSPGRKIDPLDFARLASALRPALSSHSEAGAAYLRRRRLTSPRIAPISITLYNINPFGVSESIMDGQLLPGLPQGRRSSPTMRNMATSASRCSPSRAEASRSNPTATLTGMIQKCLTDADSWYEITFDPPPADKPNEYHHIEIQLDQPGLVARTRNGYYSNPVATDPAR